MLLDKSLPILSTKKLSDGVCRYARLQGFTIMDHDFIRIHFIPYSEDGISETLIFTSANAVSAFAGNRQAVRHHKVYCLQGKTSDAASRLENIRIMAVAEDALSLAKKIAADRPAEKVSFICGCQRRNELPDYLHRQGIAVEEIKVYETIYTGFPVKDAYSGVLFFSPSAVESFFQSNILKAGITCFCIGKTTEASVKKHTSRVVTATEPTQESMLAALTCFFRKKYDETKWIIDNKPMKQMTKSGLENDLLLKALKGETVERPPVWMMRQAGRYLPEYMALKKRYDFFTRVQTPELAAEITLQPVNSIGTDAAIIFSDILVVPLAMGLDVQVTEGQGPVLSSTIQNIYDVQRLVVNEAHYRLQYVYDAIALAKEQLAGRVPLIGFAGAPWTILCYMVEGKGSKTFDKAKAFCYRQPEAAHTLLQAITSITIAYLKSQVQAGADCIQLFDSWGGLWDKEDFAVFSLPYIHQIVAALRNDCPVIVYAKGVWHSLPELQQTGAAALGIDWCHTPQTARELTSGSITLQGNYDPLKLLQPADKIKEDVWRMINAFGPQRYIVNLGHGITPQAPVAHAKAFIESVKTWKA